MLAGVIPIAVALSASLVPQSLAFDLIFAGGRVIDGTGAPWFRADVGIVGDRIAAIGDLSTAAAARRIDASRLVVAPGFIDMLGQSEYNVLVDNRAASKITQGITTEITGEGRSIAPMNARMIADAKDTWARYGVTPDWTTPAELHAMEAVAYVPDKFASTEEIIALAKVAARYGGTYITHQRDEGDGIDRSLDEVFSIAREARIPAQIYHLKTAGKRNWGRMPAILRRIEQARADGLDVSANQYPWAASSNNLDASLPLWVREGGREKLVARLKDPATRARVRPDFLKEYPDWSDEPGSRILITRVLNPALKGYEGKTLAEIARSERKDPLDALMDIVIADRANTGRVTFSMSEEDVQTALAHPLVSMGTDSGAKAEDGIYSEEQSHPRAWGSAPRILGHYVREEKLLTLEEAIRKMTSLPASRMGLADRGIVRPGMAADVVAFDPATVRERSTYADPLHYSEGIPFVCVNGQLVVDGGRITDARPGRLLLGPGYRTEAGRNRRKRTRYSLFLFPHPWVECKGLGSVDPYLEKVRVGGIQEVVRFLRNNR